MSTRVRLSDDSRGEPPRPREKDAAEFARLHFTVYKARRALHGKLTVTIYRTMPTIRSALLGVAAAATFVTITYGQSILGPPSEANHFIETPKGWVHPKTPWGEPDIQATLNMMQAAGVPLERCANSYRFGGPPCDMNKKWWTEEEHAKRIADARGRGDLGRELIQKGEFGRALLTGVTDPATPQRQTNLIVDPPSGLLPESDALGL